MMDIQGFAWIKPDADSIMSSIDEKHFKGKVGAACIEITEDGNVMAFNSDPPGLAMIDAKDVAAYFRCRMYGGLLIPDVSDPIKQMYYYGLALEASNGNARMFNATVIAVGLQKGEYYMDILNRK